MQATAYAVSKPGLKLTKQKIDVPEPKDNEVLIQITHCSVGQGDVGFLKNTYEIPNLKYPLVAGHELVGKIVKAGQKAKQFATGDRIGVGYQVWSCGKCEYCLSHEEQLCQQQLCLVQDKQGGFATHITVDRRFVFKVPDALDSARATPLFCSGLTVYSAIKKASVKKGMRVGVIGIGGLGHIAVQLLHYLGTNVTAFSSKSQGLKNLGANEILPYGSTKATAKTFDRIFVTTHAHINYDFYLNLLKPDGEFWVIGSDINKSTFSSWLLNDFASRSIRGSYIGSPTETQELLELAAAHDLGGEVKLMPMSRINEALQLVADGNNNFRIVVTNA